MISKTMFKNILLTLALCAPLIHAQEQPAADIQASVGENGAGAVTLTAKGVLPQPKLFFTADAKTSGIVKSEEITQTTELNVKILQGRPEMLTLGLAGEGQITSVTGAGLKDWAVRTALDGQRFLDLQPELTKGKPAPGNLKLTVVSKYEVKSLPARTQLLTITPGRAAGFSLKLSLTPTDVDVKIAKISGMSPLDKKHHFHSTGQNALTLQLTPNGASQAPVELKNVRVTGTVDEKLGSATLSLTATAHVTNADGGTIDFLGGRAAVSAIQPDAAYKLKIARDA